MNIIDRFSTHLREVLVGSIRIATDLKNSSVEPMHLLLALSMQKGILSIGTQSLILWETLTSHGQKMQLS